MNWDRIYPGETRELDDAARAEAGGSFIRLPQGCTHYELVGPAAAELVVLIHGFSVPYFIWDPTFEALVAAGKRVLRYDLFGRGYSDRPHANYSLSLFVRQLSDLLAAIDIRQADLIGLSMGGAIAAGFTAEFPDLVHRLVLIDPIGAEAMPLNLFYKAALIPGVSELLLSLIGTDTMVKALASDFYDRREVERFQDRYRVQMDFRGFKRAIISTLRNKTVDGFPQVFERLGQLATPVLLLWGRQDRTLPIEQSASILSRVPRAQFKIIENCGHIPNCERAGIVNPMILKFLTAQ